METRQFGNARVVMAAAGVRHSVAAPDGGGRRVHVGRRMRRPPGPQRRAGQAGAG